MTSSNVGVHDLFVIGDRHEIIVRLQSFDWDFTLGVVVSLRQAEEKLACRQVRSGNIEGKAAVTLVPVGAWHEATALVSRWKTVAQPIVLEPGGGA